jgi:dienelactone hydrolase
LLHVPSQLRASDRSAVHTILVLPNNTGTGDNDPAVHEKAARRLMGNVRPSADQMGMVLLLPIFPRPKTEWRTYTHALDRDTLRSGKPELKRLDRQLVAMIDHARRRLATEGMTIDPRVLVFGFSASGMFTNRFTFLHPERVKAAAIGSPGGWPIAPVAEERGKKLRYPIGVGDFEEVNGQPLDITRLAEVPLFLFMGDKDGNDSVVFRDSYDDEDEKLVLELFGKTPVERWPAAERLYRGVLPKAKFKLYPGVEHKITPEMHKDVLAFFQQHIKGDGGAR